MPRMWLCSYTPSRAPSALNPPQKISVFPGRSPGTSCSWRRLQRRCAACARPGSGAPATQTVVTPAADPSPSAAWTSAQATPSHSEPSLDSSSAAPAAAAAPLDATASAWGAKLMLLGTAALWGTYAPSLRLVYTMTLPPDPVVVMAVRGTLQTGALLLAAALAAPDGEGSSSGGAGSSSQQPGTSGSGASSSAAGSGEAVPAEEAMSLLKRWLRQQSPPLWVAALELGLWNYGATALQTFGLTLTSATRASFLVQATALLTPLLAALAGHRPSGRVWAACTLALGGTLLIAQDKVAAAGSAASAASEAAGLHLGGDAAILLAALFYSCATVRVTGYARSLPPLRVAAGKTVVLGAVAVAGFAAAATSVALQGGQVSELWPGWQNPVAWAVLVWSALGPGALAAYFHVRGQKDVPPAEAQILFSSVPLWSAAFAWLLLGGEDLGPLTWLGGSTLVAAGVLASTGPTTAAQATERQKLRGAAPKS